MKVRTGGDSPRPAGRPHGWQAVEPVGIPVPTVRVRMGGARRAWQARPASLRRSILSGCRASTPGMMTGEGLRRGMDIRLRHTPLPLRIAAPIVAGLVFLLVWWLVTSFRIDSRDAAAQSWHRRRTSRQRAGVRTAVGPHWCDDHGGGRPGCLLASVIALPTAYLIAHVRLAEATLAPTSRPRRPFRQWHWHRCW